MWAQPGGQSLRFTLVGSIPPKKTGWSALAQEDPRVLSTGRVRDMDPFLNAARVFVSPIVVGTGLNVKNLVALEYGLPMVTTIIGAEGLRLSQAEGNSPKAHVATSALEMADAIVALHSNQTLWEQFHAKTVEHAKSFFSLEKARPHSSALLWASIPIAELQPSWWHPAPARKLRRWGRTCCRWRRSFRQLCRRPSCAKHTCGMC